MRVSLGLIFLLVFPISGLSQDLPVNAVKYVPLLKEVMMKKWSGNKSSPFIPAQIEQETCPSLKSKKCWSSTTELKTDREYGFGLGQITVTSKFNTFDDVKKLDKDLAPWKWEDRYDPRQQLTALVVMDASIISKLPKPILEKLAFMFAVYNGGYGAIINQDRKLCSGTPNCNPDLWFGQVEKTSFKSKIKLQGYGKSFFEVNREYVKNIMYERYLKYVDIMNKT